ncbi:MAG: DNA-binding protein [Thermotoga sp.]|nr:MAG: DNA-binding protein [Thermotoga sp.]
MVGRSKDEVLTIRELSIFLKISKGTLYRYLRSGLIPGKKIGGRWRVLKSEIVSFLKGEKRSSAQRGEENQNQLQFWVKKSK